MRIDICNFVKEVCEELELEGVYIPNKDLYMMTKHGRAVAGFTTEQFYQIPKVFRKKEINMMLRVGLNHNLGESYRDSLFQKRKLGHVIYEPISLGK